MKKKLLFAIPTIIILVAAVIIVGMLLSTNQDNHKEDVPTDTLAPESIPTNTPEPELPTTTEEPVKEEEPVVSEEPVIYYDFTSDEVSTAEDWYNVDIDAVAYEYTAYPIPDIDIAEVVRSCPQWIIDVNALYPEDAEMDIYVYYILCVENGGTSISQSDQFSSYYVLDSDTRVYIVDGVAKVVVRIDDILYVYNLSDEK